MFPIEFHCKRKCATMRLWTENSKGSVWMCLDEEKERRNLNTGQFSPHPNYAKAMDHYPPLAVDSMIQLG